MNIARESLGELVSLLRVTVEEGDYAPAVDKMLHDYRRKANIPGFRPGMVPMGIINKMYRKGAIAEQAYKVASEACSKYMEENGIDYIGDIMPGEGQKPLDFENNLAHEFLFEFAEAPKVNIELPGKEKLTRYEIRIDKKMEENYRSSYMRKFGRLVDADSVEGEDALTVTLDNEAMNISEAYVGLIQMSEEQRKPFVGRKVGDSLPVNVDELYPNPAQRASILQLKEAELEGINPNFTLTITRIRRFAEPELTPEFFKNAFPGGEVADEAGLAKHLRTQIEAELARESGYLLAADVRALLLKKADLQMPVEFLKKWLAAINENRFSPQEIERDFGPFLEMMKWSLVRKHFIATLGVEVTPDDALAEAKNVAMAQFAQYGLNTASDEMLAPYAKSMLENREQAKKIYEQLFDNKVIEAVTPLIPSETKSVTADQYSKIVDERNAA
ncbi:MAG: trigger factor [Rikenellaceae bacterium]|jgi:trigger factor|nr:trigger factor [Rikenellaceae bacterium]